MLLPQEAYKYIRIQRTDAKKLGSDDNVARFYESEIEREWGLVSGLLPPVCNSFVDIGCGVGGIGTKFYEKYGCDIIVVDKTKVSESIRYRDDNDNEYYNDLKVTIDVLNQNGVPFNKIRIIEPELFKHTINDWDIVYSSLSWGFHYAPETYNPRSKIRIMDIRKHYKTPADYNCKRVTEGKYHYKWFCERKI